MRKCQTIVSVVLLSATLLQPALVAATPRNTKMSYSHQMLADPGNGVGMLTRFCLICAGNAQDNWPDCGRCHIGGKRGGDWATGKADCEVCHSETYLFEGRFFDQEKGEWDYTSFTFPSKKTKTVTDQACLRCHEEAFRYKRGTPFSAPDDVHAGRLTCIDCHVVKKHQIARGRFVVDLSANDRPEVEVSCTKCHLGRESTIHGGVTRAGWEQGPHRRISCQACHIRQTGGLVYRDWSDPNGPPYLESVEELQPYEAVSFKYGSESGPVYVYRWWDGTKNEKQEPVFGRSPSAYLWPLKVLRVTLAENILPEGNPPGADLADLVQMSHGIKATGMECITCHANNAVGEDAEVPQMSERHKPDSECRKCHAHALGRKP